MSDLIDRQVVLKDLEEYMVNAENAISVLSNNIHNYNSGLLTAIQVVTDTLSAQFEQIRDKRTVTEDRETPKKPIEASEQHKRIGYDHDCPSCGCALGFKEKKNGVLPRFLRKTVLYEQCQQYCGFCGQKIDWYIDWFKKG